MTKHLYFLLFPVCFLFVTTSLGQQKQIDSIQYILENLQTDSLKNAKLKEVVDHYQDRDPVLHLYHTKKLYVKAFHLKKGDEYGNALLELSHYQRNKGNIDSSYYYVEQAAQVFTNTQNDDRLIFAINAKAQVLQDQRKFVEATKLYKEVIAYYETKKSEEDIKQLFITKMNLSTVYFDIIDWDSAEDILMDLYNDPRVKQDIETYSSVCINLIIVKRRQYDPESAVKFGEEALALETRPKSLANLYSSLASAHGRLKHFEKADAYYKKSLEINTKLGRVRSVNSGNHNIGYNLMEWGKYDEAKEYFLIANKLFKDSDDLAALQKSYQALAEVSYAKEDFQASVHYFVQEGAIGDSIFGINKQKAISELEIKYETEKTKREKNEAENQVAISQLESKKNKSLFLGSLLVIGLVGIASLFFFGRLKARKKADMVTLELHETQKRLALEKQYRDSELKALKAQMNPHFIFNALNSIQEYIILNKKNLAGDYLGKFADLMRKYLHHSDAGTLTIQDEIESLEMYLDLEALRFEDTLSYSFNVSEEINRDQIVIPTMLVQPYIENALKHGLLHRKTDRKLSVSFKKETAKAITCYIEDNGVGREKSEQIKAQRGNTHVSFATKATENRLDLLNYQKDHKIGVETIDLYEEDGSARGTKVILHIPILTK